MVGYAKLYFTLCCSDSLFVLCTISFFFLLCVTSCYWSCFPYFGFFFIALLLFPDPNIHFKPGVDGVSAEAAWVDPQTTDPNIYLTAPYEAMCNVTITWVAAVILRPKIFPRLLGFFSHQSFFLILIFHRWLRSGTGSVTTFSIGTPARLISTRSSLPFWKVLSAALLSRICSLPRTGLMMPALPTKAAFRRDLPCK